MKTTISRLRASYVDPNGSQIELGTLAGSGRSDAAIYFEAADRDAAELAKKLSPLTLRCNPGIPVKPRFDGVEWREFYGLFGLFADSLPDTFGRRVAEQALQKCGLPAGPLELLSYVGSGGRGALRYEPEVNAATQGLDVTLEELFEAAHSMAAGSPIDLCDPATTHAMGTAGGTRPKAYCVHQAPGTYRVARDTSNLDVNEVACIIKFDCTGYFDGKLDHEAASEFACLQMALDCGIRVPEHWQECTESNRRHLVMRRFDRSADGNPIHLHSFYGLAHAAHTSRLADYELLLRATLRLTRNANDIEDAFRRVVFNTFVCNQDDHPKQHAFLFDGTQWTLSPAYDLTVCPQPSFGHSMTLFGKRSWGESELFELAEKFGVSNAEDAVERTKEVMSSSREYFANAGVPDRKCDELADHIERGGLVNNSPRI